MSTGKDYGLPEEYHDWVLRKSGGNAPYIRVTFELCESLGKPVPIMWAYLFPPTPRPTLPDVAVGGIVDYWTREGLHRRVIRTTTSSGWMTSDGFYVRGDDLLIDVNDDGFTVVLEGL